jgi:hypothetical protein
MEQMRGVKWDDLAKLEPELETLLRFARQQGDLCRASRKWSDVKYSMAYFTYYILLLVGFASEHRGHPILGTDAAFDVARCKIHNALARDRRRGE